MGTPASQSCDLSPHITQQYLPLFDTLDLDLAFLTRLEVKATDAFQLIFLSHNSRRRGK